MGDLVRTHLGFADTAGTKSKLRSVSNISEWLQAFAIYVSIIARKQPERIPDLMGYQILILEASNEYQNNGWLAQHTTGASDCKLPLNPTADGPTQTPHFGIYSFHGPS